MGNAGEASPRPYGEDPSAIVGATDPVAHCSGNEARR